MNYRLSDLPREHANAVLIERYRLATAAWRAGRDLNPFRRPLPLQAPAAPTAIPGGISPANAVGAEVRQPWSVE